MIRMPKRLGIRTMDPEEGQTMAEYAVVVSLVAAVAVAAFVLVPAPIASAARSVASVLLP